MDPPKLLPSYVAPPAISPLFQPALNEGRPLMSKADKAGSRKASLASSMKSAVEHFPGKDKESSLTPCYCLADI